MLMFMHRPDTVTAARLGEPALADPPRTVAPQVTKKVVGDFNAAFGTPAADAAAPAKAGTPTAAAEAGGAAAPAAPAAPLQLNDVKSSEADATSGGGSTGGADLTAVPSATTGAGGVTAGATRGATFGGVEILNNSPNGTAADTAPGGLKAVGPANAAPLPPAEKAAAAPDLPNEIAPGQAPAAQAPRADGKKTKAPAFDKGDESSSKHKKKKGIKKIVPVI